MSSKSNLATSHTSLQNPLKSDELRLIDAWWRACSYLSVGMIYLKDNPLLKEVYKRYAEGFRGGEHLRRIQREAQALLARTMAGVQGK